MSRTRSRRQFHGEYRHGSYVNNWQGFQEHMTESSYPGSCNVEHRRDGLFSAQGTYQGLPISWTNGVGYTPPIGLPRKLNWGKLPTSSEFGLIQFFAELDDTLAMFSTKFLKEFSYGSFTWGVMPFVHETKALLQTVQNLSKNLSRFDYEDEYEDNIPFDYNDPYGGNFKGSIKCNYRLTGHADISFQSDAAKLLDRLGFHPDLATAWDLVPFSFVVDYVLPVGEFLDSLRGGGWIKVAAFTGWSTCKWTCEGTWKYNPAPSITSKYTSSGFSRWNSSNILTIAPEVTALDLQKPSFRQIFNAVYLAGSKRK